MDAKKIQMIIAFRADWLGFVRCCNGHGMSLTTLDNALISHAMAAP
jgi:hypothetical protein